MLLFTSFLLNFMFLSECLIEMQFATEDLLLLFHIVNSCMFCYKGTLPSTIFECSIKWKMDYDMGVLSSQLDYLLSLYAEKLLVQMVM